MNNNGFETKKQSNIEGIDENNVENLNESPAERAERLINENKVPDSGWLRIEKNCENLRNMEKRLIKEMRKLKNTNEVLKPIIIDSNTFRRLGEEPLLWDVRTVGETGTNFLLYSTNENGNWNIMMGQNTHIQARKPRRQDLQETNKQALSEIDGGLVIQYALGEYFPIMPIDSIVINSRLKMFGITSIIDNGNAWMAVSDNKSRYIIYGQSRKNYVPLKIGQHSTIVGDSQLQKGDILCNNQHKAIMIEKIDKEKVRYRTLTSGRQRADCRKSELSVWQKVNHPINHNGFNLYEFNNKAMKRPFKTTTIVAEEGEGPKPAKRARIIQQQAPPQQQQQQAPPQQYQAPPPQHQAPPQQYQAPPQQYQAPPQQPTVDLSPERMQYNVEMFKQQNNSNNNNNNNNNDNDNSNNNNSVDLVINSNEPGDLDIWNEHSIDQLPPSVIAYMDDMKHNGRGADIDLSRLDNNLKYFDTKLTWSVETFENYNDILEFGQWTLGDENIFQELTVAKLSKWESCVKVLACIAVNRIRFVSIIDSKFENTSDNYDRMYVKKLKEIREIVSKNPDMRQKMMKKLNKKYLKWVLSFFIYSYVFYVLFICVIYMCYLYVLFICFLCVIYMCYLYVSNLEHIINQERWVKIKRKKMKMNILPEYLKKNQMF